MILKTDNITMQFGGVTAVNLLNIEINEHEIVALIGPNGAGKTTGQLLADGGSAFELSFGRSGKKVIGTTRGGSLELVDLVL